MNHLRYLWKKRKTILYVCDMCIVIFSFVLSMLLYPPLPNALWDKTTVSLLLIDCVFHSIVFFAFGLYKVIWRYSSPNNLLKCVVASLFASLAIFPVAYAILPMVYFGGFFVHFITISLLLILARMMYIYLYAIVSELRAEKVHPIEEQYMAPKKKTLIIGAGEAGKGLISDMQKSNYKYPYLPVCIVDDDIGKKSRYVHGVAVMGIINDIPELCKKLEIDVIILAILSLDEERRKEILSICSSTGCQIKKIPAVSDLRNMNENLLQLVSDVNIEDLLGRSAVQLNISEMCSYIKDKVVLVTGGGGSIGSELCRQIAKYAPKRMIILDIYENNAYSIQQELVRTYTDSLNISVEIASVRDQDKIRWIIEKYMPDIIFHAAAHKHVPLMESNPEEAVKNNIVGTYNVAQQAGVNGVKRFILISTDKAVNPTNIMGATKRCCEMVIQGLNSIYETEYAAVRFGNVLGSNGSVIPLFERQIAEGGPVTVTHPDIIRYFMTITEAAQLVLSAGSMAQGGEIFILDMGKPVKILDMAKNLIYLSGLVPGRDIQIEFTGLRPGEKLYEELLVKEEGLERTVNEKIFVSRVKHIDELVLFKQLEHLLELALSNDSKGIRAFLKEIVPTYIPKDSELTDSIGSETENAADRKKSSAQATKQEEIEKVAI